MVLATLALFGCSELADLQLDTCGNGVWEPMAGEDCDTNAVEGRCGLVGSKGACRFVCTTSNDCPGGRRCGDDGICRLPVRQFVPSPNTPLASVGTDLTVADLDLDGHADLIGTTARGAAVLFGTGAADFEDRRTLITGSPRARVTSAKVGTSDGRRIVTPMGAGVQINRVDEQRNLRPVANAVLPFELADRVRLIRVANNGPQDWIVVLFDAVRKLRVFTEYGVSASGEIDGQLAQLAGPPATGDLDGDGVDEIVFAFVGTREAIVLGLVCDRPDPVEACRGDLSWTTRATIEFSDDFTRGVAVADANADGRLDVFVGVANSVHVAFGNGDATFTPSRVDARIEDACRVGCSALAIQDIDADGLADYILDLDGDAPDTLLLTTSTTSVSLRHRASAGELSQWTSVAFGDFDGDGRRDVAVAQAERFGFEIVYVADAPLYNAFFEETMQPLASLVAGDFDGDGIDDVATVTMGFDDQAVVVHYGSTAGLGEGVEMGRFAQVERILPAFLAGLRPDAPDYRADLVVETLVGSTEHFTLLIATPEHQMVSPILLTDSPALPEAALAVASGTFKEDSTSEDLLVVTQDAVRVIPSDTDGGFPTLLSTVTPQTLVRGDTSRRLIEAVQLDADPLTEVLIVTAAHPNQDEDRTKLVVFDPNGQGGMSSVEVALPETIRNPTSVRLASVPPFGDRVVVLGFHGGSAASGGVALFAVDPAGNVASQPAALLMAEEGRRVLSAEVANIDSDARPELIVLTEDDVRSIEIRDGALVWGPPIALGDVNRPPSTFATMRAADLDRDGLVDLAIGNEFGLYVYRAIERQELEP